MLEFICALQTEHLTPEKLFHELEHNHLLLIGSDFSNWLARLFLRMAKRKRLSDPRDVGEVLADDHTLQDERLVAFLQQVSVRTRVYGGAEAFVAELHARWTTRAGPAPPVGRARPPRRSASCRPRARCRSNAVFISYAREDLPAVQRLKAGARRRRASRPGSTSTGSRAATTTTARSAQHRALRVLHARHLGDDAAPARGLLPPRVELRGGSLAQHRRRRGVHPAGLHRRHARGARRCVPDKFKALHITRLPGGEPSPEFAAAPARTSSAGAAHERARRTTLAERRSRSTRSIPGSACPRYTEETRALLPRPRGGGRGTRAPRAAQAPHRAVRPVGPRQDLAAARRARAAAARPRASARSTCASTTRRESPPPAEQIKQAIFRATAAAGHWTQAGHGDRGRVAVGVPAPPRRRAARRERPARCCRC